MVTVVEGGICFNGNKGKRFMNSTTCDLWMLFTLEMTSTPREMIGNPARHPHPLLVKSRSLKYRLSNSLKSE